MSSLGESIRCYQRPPVRGDKARPPCSRTQCPLEHQQRPDHKRTKRGGAGRASQPRRVWHCTQHVKRRARHGGRSQESRGCSRLGLLGAGPRSRPGSWCFSGLMTPPCSRRARAAGHGLASPGSLGFTGKMGSHLALAGPGVSATSCPYLRHRTHTQLHSREPSSRTAWTIGYSLRSLSLPVPCLALPCGPPVAPGWRRQRQAVAQGLGWQASSS